MKKDIILSISRISLPIAMQGLLLCLIGFVDSLMMSHLSDDHLAATGIGARWFFFISIFLYSITTAGSILLSQLNGADKKDRYMETVRLNNICMGLVSLFLGFSVIVFAKPFAGLMTENEHIHHLASQYLAVMGWGIIVTGLSITFDSVLRSLKKTSISLYCFIIEILINLVLNYCLIFGNFGFPEMGIVGAGVASVIARSIRTMLLLGVLSRILKVSVVGLIYAAKPIKRGLLDKYLVIAWPIAVSSLVWPSGVFVLHIIFARMGDLELAAMSFITPFEWIGIAMVSGIQQGAAIYIGNEIGKGNSQQIKLSAELSIWMSLVFGLVTSFIFYIVGLLIIRSLDMSVELKDMIVVMLPVLSLSIAIRSVVGTQVQGILKCAGETKFCMYLDVISQWVITIPSALLAVYYFNLSIFFVYLIVQFEEIIKAFPSYLRIKSGRWVRGSVAEL